MGDKALQAEIVTDDDQEHTDTDTPTREVARRPASTPSATPGAPMGLFGTENPRETIAAMTEHAEALTEVLESRHLYTQIRDRRHVRVEGWTMLGSMVGVFPRTAWTRQVPDHEGIWRPPVVEDRIQTLHSKRCSCGRASVKVEIREGCETWTPNDPVAVVVEAGRGGWEARVEAVTSDGRVVGAAEAECRWDESSWRNRDSHALRSMAGTRATSKALRLPLGFIVELAGFDATPAEEMTGVSGGYDEPEDPNAPKCPACGSEVFDNRPANVEREAQGKNPMPAFKCKNRSCTGSEKGDQWISWSSSFFEPEPEQEDYTGTAKKRVLEAAQADLGSGKGASGSDRWEDRYLSAEQAKGPLAEMIGQAVEAFPDQLIDAMHRAQIMWAEIADGLNLKADDVLTKGYAESIGQLASQMLLQPEKAPSDLFEGSHPDSEAGAEPDPWDGYDPSPYA